MSAKTYDKYRRIMTDLESIIGRRPVEDMRADDLAALCAVWRGRGNGPTTIADKLSTIRDLCRPVDREGLIALLTRNATPRALPSGAKRLPLLESQVASLVTMVWKDPSLPDTDRVVLALMLLTGSRLEEVCQLESSDLLWERGVRLLQIAGAAQTGRGDAKVKHACTARRLPLAGTAAFPGLDAWLDRAAVRGGKLFPSFTADKYGRVGGAASKRLNRRLRRLISTDGRLVLQSTRPTAVRAMRRGGCDLRLRMRHLGHSDRGVHVVYYEPADLLDDLDLLDTATAIAAFLARALEGQELPSIGPLG